MKSKRKLTRKHSARPILHGAGNGKRSLKASRTETTEEKLRQILERVDQLPTLSDHSAEEILGYGSNGAFR